MSYLDDIQNLRERYKVTDFGDGKLMITLPNESVHWWECFGRESPIIDGCKLIQFAPMRVSEGKRKMAYKIASNTYKKEITPAEALINFYVMSEVDGWGSPEDLRQEVGRYSAIQR